VNGRWFHTGAAWQKCDVATCHVLLDYKRRILASVFTMPGSF